MSDSVSDDDDNLFKENEICIKLLDDNIEHFNQIIDFATLFNNNESVNYDEIKAIIENNDNKEQLQQLLEQLCENFICFILYCLNDKRNNLSYPLGDTNERFWYDTRVKIAIYIIYISLNYMRKFKI